MRNLTAELKELNLTLPQIESVLIWINTLTNQDLYNNGSENACFVAGDRDYEEFSAPTLNKRIQTWIEDNIDQYRNQECGRLSLMKDLRLFFRPEFELSLRDCKSYIEKNW